MSAQKLYTPEMLGLALELAAHPLDPQLTVVGEARSQSCGSTLAMNFSLDGDGRIEKLGMRARACAVGQAAAAIFARHAVGRNAEDLAAALEAIRSWLADAKEDGLDLPDWPDLAMIEAARDFPGRHGAILLPWQAAVSALSTAPAAR